MKTLLELRRELKKINVKLKKQTFSFGIGFTYFKENKKYPMVFFSQAEVNYWLDLTNFLEVNKEKIKNLKEMY